MEHGGIELLQGACRGKNDLAARVERSRQPVSFLGLQTPDSSTGSPAPGYSTLGDFPGTLGKRGGLFPIGRVLPPKELTFPMTGGEEVAQGKACQGEGRSVGRSPAQHPNHPGRYQLVKEKT